MEEYLQECRTLVLEQIQAIIRDGTSGDDRTYRLMVDYPLRRGKGLRPALCIAVCRAFGGSFDEVLPTAAVLELYHNAFLIHDDVEDGSLARRGGPSLHATHGTPIAVNIGDGLLALTMRPLLDNMSRLGLGRSIRILEIIARMVTESFEGQALELRWIEEGQWDLADEDYQRMVLKKTGWYSFVAPALVGAIVARAGSTVETRLGEFLTGLALAFQIQDDVLNLEEDRRSYGKEHAGDLWEGKRTLILLHALRHASVGERARALRILDKPRPRPGGVTAQFEELLEEMRAAHVIDAETHLGVGRFLKARLKHTTEKTLDDLHFLRGLVDRFGSIQHARKVAHRHALAAQTEWRGLAEMLQDTVHLRFLGWLTDYVVQREW